jgi:hypothetical protein
MKFGTNRCNMAALVMVELVEFACETVWDGARGQFLSPSTIVSREPRVLEDPAFGKSEQLGRLRSADSFRWQFGDT